MKNSLIVTIVVAVIIGALAFYGGTRYQLGKLRSGFPQGRNNQFGQRSNNTGIRPINGEILKADDKSITVKLQDGSSKIVILSDSTSINKAAEGTKSDLKTGEKVMVIGTTNSDGSVTAQNIQLNPINRGGLPK